MVVDCPFVNLVDCNEEYFVMIYVYFVGTHLLTIQVYIDYFLHFKDVIWVKYILNIVVF